MSTELFTRREAISLVPAVAGLALATTPSSSSGRRRFTLPKSEKFSGDGWYAFDFAMRTGSETSIFVVQFAEAVGRQEIRLGDGKGFEQERMTISAAAFDRYCIGKVGKAT